MSTKSLNKYKNTTNYQSNTNITKHIKALNRKSEDSNMSDWVLAYGSANVCSSQGV